MKSKPAKNITPVSQVSREEARKLVEKMVTDWLQDRDDRKALTKHLIDRRRLAVELRMQHAIKIQEQNCPHFFSGTPENSHPYISRPPICKSYRQRRGDWSHIFARRDFRNRLAIRMIAFCYRRAIASRISAASDLSNRPVESPPLGVPLAASV